MLSRPLIAVTLTAAAAACWPAASAQPRAASTQPRAASTQAPSMDVRAWLLRIHEAASHRNFQGIFVVSGGGNIASARIAHYRDGPDQYEFIESLDGRQRKVFRFNDVVHTLWPASHVALVERRGFLSSFPALLQGGGDGLAEWYEVKDEGLDRMAGYQANVMSVKARDAYRYGYRLWADRDSGLLLRADVIGERGDVLETSAFSEVSIGVRPQSDDVIASMKKLDGYQVVRPVLAPTTLDAQGWSMRKLAPGFRLVGCVSRQIVPEGGEAADPALPPVVQSVYSDGLTYVSVFIEAYRADRHARPMLALLGATLTLAQRHGDWWVTVVGDTPAATLKLFAASLERRKP